MGKKRGGREEKMLSFHENFFFKKMKWSLLLYWSRDLKEKKIALEDEALWKGLPEGYPAIEFVQCLLHKLDRSSHENSLLCRGNLEEISSSMHRSWITHWCMNIQQQDDECWVITYVPWRKRPSSRSFRALNTAFLVAT